MDHNTTALCDDNECAGCAPDPALPSGFKHAIYALGGKWKLEILFSPTNGAMRPGALRRAVGAALPKRVS